MRALVLRPWFFDDVKQENPRPTARGLYNGFCLPLAVGLPCAIAGRGAARCGGYRFCAFVVMCRAALRRVRASRACFYWRLCCARGPWAQLSIIVRGLRAEGWLGVAGDVSYGPSSAIGTCGGGMVAFLGAKVTI